MEKTDAGLAKRRSLILSASLAALSLGIGILLYFFPYLFALMLPLLIPVTAYLGIRTRGAGLALNCSAVVAVAVLVNRVSFYALLPVYALGVAGLMVATGRAAGVGFAIVAASYTLGLLGVLVVAASVYRCNPMEAAARYIRASDSPAVLRLAKEYQTDCRMAERDVPPMEYAAVRAEVYREVDALPAGYLLEQYSLEVRQDLYDNLMKYLGTLIPLLTAGTYWLHLLLVRLYQGGFEAEGGRLVCTKRYEVGPLNEWQLPKGYLLGVFPPLMLLFLIGLSNDTAMTAFTCAYPLLIVVPYSVAGLSIIAYLFTRNGKHYIPAVVTAALVGIFLYPFLAVLGIADYLLHTRKLLKIFDETDTI